MSNELFEQGSNSNDNEEFQLGEEKKPEAQSSAKPEAKLVKKNKGKPLTTQDKVVFGGIAVLGLGAALWLFMPSGNHRDQPVSSQSQVNTASMNNQPTVDNDFQTQISEILIKQKQQQDKDRADYQQGMNILSQQLKVANARVDQLSQQLNELRMSSASTQTADRDPGGEQSTYAEKALKGYSINDISQELAWIKYKGQLYVVKQGTEIGSVIVTRIDPSNRIVYTDRKAHV